ncbi:MAG: 1,4-dihydroxy-2-naphthoate octaprenyltransferase [Bacteroidales bacterium]|nr:1,4-dihydroxy-2-naphthoate octaprenyltransferase [Bacteroidales bacterium]
MKILLWLRIIRPQTLFASLVPVLVGLIIASSSQPSGTFELNALTAVITVICALSLQILSNLINDYYDFIRGSDKAGRAGFKRALAEGEVSVEQMRRACFITLAVALITGLYLVIEGGWPILLAGVTAIIFAWLYTATSHSLSYLGIADIFVFLYYGVIASCGTTYLQTHTFCLTSFHAGAVCGLISMCVLMINNLRDIESDRAAGKRTLPVRLGKHGAEAVMAVEVLLMPLFAYLAFGFSIPMLIGPAVIILFVAVLKARGAQYNKCLLCTGLMNVLYYILIAL